MEAKQLKKNIEDYKEGLVGLHNRLVRHEKDTVHIQGRIDILEDLIEKCAAELAEKQPKFENLDFGREEDWDFGREEDCVYIVWQGEALWGNGEKTLLEHLPPAKGNLKELLEQGPNVIAVSDGCRDAFLKNYQCLTLQEQELYDKLKAAKERQDG